MKKILLGLTLFALAVVVGLYCLGTALQQQPEFYATALRELPNAEVRQQEANHFEQAALELVEDFKHSEEWSQSFSQTEINSWLAEDLEKEFLDTIPQEMSDFRIQLKPDTILFGFRLQSRNWTGVASVEIRPWMAAPNQLALEIVSARAGTVPLPLDKPLNELAEKLRNHKLSFKWRQNNGNDVLVIPLSELLEKHEDKVVQSIQVLEGEFRITGGQLPPNDMSNEKEQKVGIVQQPPSEE